MSVLPVPSKKTLGQLESAPPSAEELQAYLTERHAALLELGQSAEANLIFSAVPNATDTVTIGADVYEFVAAAGTVAVDTNIAVLLTGVLATDRLALIAAINAGNALNAHASIFLLDGVTPALANGTENLLAVLDTANVMIRSATEPGGTVTHENPSIVLAEAITDAGGADVWAEGNVNMNTLGGIAPESQVNALMTKTVTAAMITNGTVFRFGFPVSRFTVQARSAAGVIRGPLAALSADAFTIVNGQVVVNFATGAAPDMVATDILTIHGWR
jgi:hypothetical protein